MSMQSIIKHTVDSIKDNSPAILTAFGIAGVAITAYLTAKATVRAVDTIRMHEGSTDTFTTFKQKVALTWPYYVAPAISCGITVGSILGSQAINAKRQAALFTAVTLGETAFSEYREKAIESIGKHKEQKIRDEVIQDKVTAKEHEFSQLKLLKADDVLCFETITGRPFVSSAEKIYQAANTVARECINNDYASLNMFYRHLGLPEVPIGETLGWSNANHLEVDLTSATVYEGKPVLAINYRNQPKVDYHSPWA